MALLPRLRFQFVNFAQVTLLAALSACNPVSDGLLNGDAGGSVNNGSSGDSVGDVTIPGGEQEPGFPVPGLDAVRARVRNESAFRADVTVRFIKDDAVVHLAFVRVLPSTVATVVSPELADIVELSGLDESGQALTTATFVLGQDFTSDSPAEYKVPSRLGDAGNDPPVVSPDPDVTPTVLELALRFPEADVTLPLGSVMDVGWSDLADRAGAIVSVYLRHVESRALTPAGPGVGALLDGLNDSLTIVVQGVEPGTYEVVGVLSDSGNEVLSVAPGKLTVVRDPFNAAPTLSITPLGGLTQLRSGGTVRVAWTDDDPDDNATITFSLESMQIEGGVERFPLGPPLAEDPDGSAADSATLTVENVLPGVYDIVGLIDDGQLVGTSRITAVVRVLPEINNDAPQLRLTYPIVNTTVPRGSSFVVRWTDSDENDDARISLLLDPDLENVPLDGNETVLIASLGEDPDGAGDQVILGIPDALPVQTFRLVGVISDGLTLVMSQAPGHILVKPAEVVGGPPGGGGTTIDDEEALTWTITVLDPPVEFGLEASDVLTVMVHEYEGVFAERPRFFLSNVPHGGSVRVEITPDIPPRSPEIKEFPLIIPTSGVPNSAWPRIFDLETEIHVNGAMHTTVASRPVWIMQDVEVVNAALVNISCSAAAAVPDTGTRFVGFELTWFGGGFTTDEAHPPVDFWLSKDAQIPAGDREDRTHRRVLQTQASPNVQRTVRIDLATLVGSDSRAAGQGGSLAASEGLAGSAIEPGKYYLLSVFDPTGPRRTVFDPYFSLFDLCNQARASSAVPPP